MKKSIFYVQKRKAGFLKLAKLASSKLAGSLTIAALVILASQGIFASISLAADTGSLAASVFVDDASVGTKAWTNVSGAQFADSVYATSTLGTSQTSHYLKATGFNFAIPAGSTINGIEASVERKASTANRINDNSVRLLKNGTLVGSNKAQTATWGTADFADAYGSATDLWGTTWSDTDINNTNFGLAFSAKRSSSSSGSYIASVDFISLTVYYTAPAVQPATNPTLGQSCGLDIALVLDNSGSINSTELSQMRSSFQSFVTTLAVTPSEFSVTSFNTTATVRQAFSANSTLVNSAIGAVPTSNGSTNWEDGLLKAQSTFDPRVSTPNLIVFASDGNPNRYGNNQGSGSGFVQEALDAAMILANNIKISGTRIITLGIGSDVNQINLEAISSADAYYSVADFSSLASTLQTLATDLCGGTITAHKIIDQDGNVQTTNDQTNAGQGWTFLVANQTKTTDANGLTPSADVTVSGGPYSVIETGGPTGYSFVSGSCSSATNNGSPTQNGVSGIQVGNNDIVSCTFYNQPLAGTLTVFKQVSGGDALPSSFTLHVNNGLPASFSGSADGVSVSVPANGSYSVTEDQVSNYSPSYSQDCSGTMNPGESKTCTVTNTFVTSEPDKGTLTVNKVVITDNGGTAQPGDFTLQVSDSAQNVTGLSNGQPIQLAPGDYTVSETGGPSGYTGAISGSCASDGTLSIAAGQNYVCTITNDDQPATLHVKKVISGSDAIASAFSFSINGGNPVSFESDGQNDLTENVGIYSVSEVAVQDYTTSYENCSQLLLANGEEATCTITNTFSTSGGGITVTDPALVKTVDNGSPAPGATIVYTLVVTNSSDVAATNVTVSDPLASSVTYVSDDAAIDADTTFDSGTNTLTWHIASIPAQGNVTLQITATVNSDASGTIANTASITGGADQGDSNTGNDSSSASVTVQTSGGDSTPTPTPTPSAAPVSSGGGGGGGSTLYITDAYQQYLNQVAQQGGQVTPTPTPSVQVIAEASPQGEVKGASTFLPATGFDWQEALTLISLLMISTIALFGLKRKLV